MTARSKTGAPTDGEKQVGPEPTVPLDIEKDTPELEAELLKAIGGPFTPYSPDEMNDIGKCILRNKLR